MLNPERAKEMLNSMQVVHWVERRTKSANTLGPNLRVATLALMGLNEQGKPIGGAGYREEHNRAQYAAMECLEQAEVEQRLQAFAALFPTVGMHIEQGWQLLTRLPYQLGSQRKAFRAPCDLSATRETRLRWLTNLISTTGPYEQNISWFATWAPYLGWQADNLGILFAGAIDAGGKEGQDVFDILVASARGEHEIGAMGRHIPRALLAASRPDGWEFIEKLLLAAQRQEGLRQSILETVDEAHPEAFRRMLRLILDHDLTRFPATVRAVDVWFGLGWDSASVRVANQAVAKVLEYLDGEGVPAQVLAGNTGSAEDTYLALWALAFRDASAAIWPASMLLGHADVERRFVGAHFLAQLGLPGAYNALLPALDDTDLRVVSRALHVYAYYNRQMPATDLFERLERVVARMPEKKKVLQPLVWPWMALSVDRQQVADALVRHLGDRSPMRLVRHLPAMDTWARAQVVETLAKNKEHLSEARDTIFSLVGDPSNYVRERAVKAVATFAITEAEAAALEKLLARKAGDLRRGALTLLLNQPDPAALSSAQRLLAVSDKMQRLAGLELLRKMAEAGRMLEQGRASAESYKKAHPSADGDEEKLIENILGLAKGERKEATLDDGLGLFDPTNCTPAVEPKNTKAGFLEKLFKKPSVTDAAAACLRSLDNLVHAHATTPVTIQTWQGIKEELLANITWNFPEPQVGVAADEDAPSLPLREMWETWYRERPARLRDHDGLELVRALVPLYQANYAPYAMYANGKQDVVRGDWEKNAEKMLFGSLEKESFRYPGIIAPVLFWLLKLHPVSGTPNLLLEGIEASVATVPRDTLAEGLQNANGYRWNPSRWQGWLQMARYHRQHYSAQWHAEHHVRYWQLLHWITAPRKYKLGMQLEEVMSAYQAGGATEADLLYQLIGPVPDNADSQYIWSSTRDFRDLQRLSARKAPPEFAKYPVLKELVDRCRQRIVEVEVERGDMPTAASASALALRYSGGLDTLVSILRSLGKESFIRGYSYDSKSKAAIFSHLVRSTFPGESDTTERFAAEMNAARIARKRQIELALYAPQWAGHVEASVGWPQLAEAVWWIHAHTKDASWTVDREIREGWTAQVSELTPLSGQSLLDGAVDVTWFNRVYEALGQKRWEELYEAAMYAAGGAGYKRAQLFADAMLGRAEKGSLVKQVTGKRQQDALRALGLLPIAPGNEREQDILDRYKVIQEFVRTSRQFGSQRQASEKLAASIAMENLARTAGYPDPIRLEWAMEAKAVEDLADGPLTITVEGVVLSLAVDAWGEPELRISRQGKPLKAVPPKIKKDPAVVGLREREKEIKRQASRMKLSLEGAMCRGDVFTAEELDGLLSHPVLAPMIERLVFTGDRGSDIAGYPVKGSTSGVALCSHAHTLNPLSKSERLRIAHSYDLLQTGQWHLWQHDLFLSEQVQPFKQVFRELYVLTGAERAEGTMSRRYEGHQVNPGQALALFGTRGWVTAPEEGVRRTFHDVGLSASVSFLQGFYTPTDVDGLTIEGVQFTRRGHGSKGSQEGAEGKPLPLSEIPPRIFSEVMRDLDLVVSVAHRGGVDPEASASTVEMRASLVRETCEMLAMGNVRLQGAHVLIDGKLGSYSVHLGSGVVHRQPGGAICIVPVHSQHRGRLFLPFADDDPKTAEVVSKVLLLAQDSRIQDPTILEQILPIA